MKPIPTDDGLLTPTQASELLKLSRDYLRSSDCPKILLPTRGTRSVVRYNRRSILAWASQWEVGVERKAS